MKQIESDISWEIVDEPKKGLCVLRIALDTILVPAGNSSVLFGSLRVASLQS